MSWHGGGNVRRRMIAFRHLRPAVYLTGASPSSGFLVSELNSRNSSGTSLDAALLLLPNFRRPV